MQIRAHVSVRKTLAVRFANKSVEFSAAAAVVSVAAKSKGTIHQTAVVPVLQVPLNAAQHDAGYERRVQ